MNDAYEVRRLQQYLTQLEAQRVSPLRRTVDEPRMPDIMTFAASPDFLGLEVYPRQGTMLKTAHLGMGPDGQELFTEYDHMVLTEWRQRMETTGEGGVQPDLFERITWNRAQRRRWFREVVFVGGRRGGKGFTGSILISYHLYWLLQLGDLQQHFRLPPHKRIVVLIFAGQREQAEANQMRDICDRVLDAECFRSSYPIVRGSSLYLCTSTDLEAFGNRRPTDNEVRTRASIEVRACGATPLSGRGPSTIGFAFDEMAHAHNAGANRSAEEIYSAAVPSLDQFRGDALLYEASSPWTPDGQLHENYQRSLAKNPDGSPAFPDMVLWHLTSWDPYLDYERAHEIPMLPGGPCFAPQPEAKAAYDDYMRALERANPATFATERRSLFRHAEDQYLAPATIDAAEAPFAGRVLQMVDRSILNIDYYAHGDPSRSGANFGFAIAHLEIIDGEPHIVFDLLHAWLPQSFVHNDCKIDYRVVTNDLKGYIDAFNPVRVSFDAWNSAGLGDELREYVASRRRPRSTTITEHQQSEKDNWRIAETFKTALGLGLVHFPEYSLLHQELLGLRFDGRRVDHAPGGTKDVADCVMTLTEHLLGDHINAFVADQFRKVPPRGGWPGGFPVPAPADSIAAKFTEAHRVAARRARARLNPYRNPAAGFPYPPRRRRAS